MIRCLIVDDSPTFLQVMRRLLASAPGVEVVGEASDGDEAIARTLELKPDVITMDVHMPRRNGLEAIAQIMKQRPTPIVVVSSAAGGEGADELTFQALKLGAVDVLGKPNALDPVHVESQAEAIRQSVRSVAGLKLITRHDVVRSERVRPVLAAPTAPASVPGASHALRCIGIVASTGGPPALQKILSALPASFPIPILVVQHIAPGFADGLVRWLSSQCALKVRLARRGDMPEPGTALFAPDDFHMMVSMGRVRLDDSPPIKSLRPSGTVLLTSLAREFGADAAGLVLTGMGDDGAAGLKLMRERGAFTAAQGRASSVVFGMPEVALRIGAAQETLELDDIAPALARLAAQQQPQPTAGYSPIATPLALPRQGTTPPPPSPLPRQGTQPAIAPSAATQPGTSERRRLLCADDAETILAFEQMVLGDCYELVLARDGQQALEAARKHLPHVILLDHSMPRMTGAQVLERLRSETPTMAIPVIMVSSETDPSIVGSWWKHGCQAVVPKPIDKNLLLSTLRRFAP